MAQMGMDVEAVENVGRDLKNQAANLGNLTGQIDRIVSSLTGIWQGKDSETFVNSWWPEHKKSLLAIQQNVDGLGQSALNNASEQRQVSGH